MRSSDATLVSPVLRGVSTVFARRSAVSLNPLLFVLILPYIEPQLFKSFDLIDDAFAGLKLFSAVIVFALYARKRFSLLVVLMIVMQTWIFFATLINDGSLVRFAGPAITSVVVLMIADLASGGDLLRFLTWLRNLLTVFFILNLLSLALMEIGVVSLPNSFLGMDNRWLYFFLPWVVIAFAVDAKNGKANQPISWLIYFLATIQLLVVWSVGAFLTMILWGVLWLCEVRQCKREKPRLFSIPCLVFVVVVILNALLVTGVLTDWFRDLIAVLKKDVTLSGRTLIWERVLQVLDESPLLSTGVQGEVEDIAFFSEIQPDHPAFHVNHPHNYFLNVAYHGGWIAGLLFLLVGFLCFNALGSKRKSLYSCCLYCGIVCFFVASLVDTLDFSLFYLMLALAYGAGNSKIESGGKSAAMINRLNERKKLQ